MPDSKITELTALTTRVLTDLLIVENDPSGTPNTKKITMLDAFREVASELTISAGAVTFTQLNHKLQPQSGTSDDLDTINGTSNGQSGVIYVADFGTDTITIKHNTGNILCVGDADIELSNGCVFWFSNGTKVFISGGGGGGAAAGGGDKYIMEFRLSLESGVPVSTTDQSNKTTIYCVPFKGNQIALYSGSAWATYTSAEFSLALGTLTSGLPYDVFCYANGSTPTLEFAAWTNTTTRATALAYQDGILVKSGATTRRYLGSFYTTSTTQTQDTKRQRLLYNYYNQMPRDLLRLEGTDTWNYSTNTWRQVNASATNQFDIMVGVSEKRLFIQASGACANSAGGAFPRISIGEDSTSTPTSNGTKQTLPSTAAGNQANGLGNCMVTPSAGYHYYAWLERDDTGSGTTTWYGDNGGTTTQSGMYGNWDC